jgi:hypothetical protein
MMLILAGNLKGYILLTFIKCLSCLLMITYSETLTLTYINRLLVNR